MADTSRFPDNGINIDPRGGVRPTPPASAAGAIIYDRGLHRWNGTSWESISPEPTDWVFVGEKDDLPAPVAGVITLADEVTYCLTTVVDLTGDRLVAGRDTVIIGGSSENCGLISTGLVGTALLSSGFSLPMRHFFITADIALALDGTGVSDAALDWYGVNFVDCGHIGTIANYSNFVAFGCAMLNSGDWTFDGTFGTVAFNQCLFQPAANQAAVTIPATATINRRFRVIYSSVVALGFQNSEGFDIDPAAFPNNESFILDTVAFSGGGTYLPGADATDNVSLFENCTGIDNSGNVTQYYMVGNAVATALTLQNTFYKIAGVTLDGPIVQKFVNTDNRATYIGALVGFFKVTAFLSLTGPANQVIGVQVAVDGVAQVASELRATTNTGGRAESVGVQFVTQLQANQYVEIWIANETSAGTNITATELQVIVERLN